MMIVMTGGDVLVGPNGWIDSHMHYGIRNILNRQTPRFTIDDDIESYSPPEYYPGDLGYYYTISTVKSMEPRSIDFKWTGTFHTIFMILMAYVWTSLIKS